MTYRMTYGIKKQFNGRYAVLTEIRDDKKCYHVHHDLSYKNPGFALKKAENFIKACHKNFVRWGEEIKFEFVNMGLIDTGENF